MTAVTLLMAGCSAPPKDSSVDFGNGEPDVEFFDVGFGGPDTGPDGSPDVQVDFDDLGQSDASVCGVDCQTLDVLADFSARSVSFDAAYFGITTPEQSGSGEWEIHVEAHRGGAAGCPTETSTSPQQTLIVTNIPLEVGTTFTREDGIAVSVLDFEGALLDDGVISSALTAELLLEYVDICTDCTPADGDGAVALAVDALFDGGGTVVGHLYATHCVSMDVR